MTNKKLPPLAVAIIIGALGIGAYLVFKSFYGGEEFIETVPVSRPVSAQNGEQTSLPSSPQPVSPEGTVTPPTVEVPDPILPVPEDSFEKQQKALTDTFKNDIKFQMDLPANYDFVRLDVDDYAETLYGTERGTNNQLAIIGAPKSGISPQAAVGFLNENSATLPMLRGREFKVSGPTKKIIPPASSGLSNTVAIPGEKRGGRMMWALIGERADKKGTYLFLMEADAALFDAGEDGLEAMMHTFRTTP